ncbi:MAG: hypothetical protein HWQ35_04975 [Nostoc sp. NMS1]|uniref:hypothetical protein n=1 Tax=unclassified Nostoc TaxID=2593658 RepID=UPI0025E2E447|nr:MULTISPECIES: hypothetical protein [unclassified Nostoc]MBN3905923.1 hypothetical protein [Nostoc sp. NMS1]MBN3993143.1 hypothetical protein [Nostoc sp. NMS2]
MSLSLGSVRTRKSGFTDEFVAKTVTTTATLNRNRKINIKFQQYYWRQLNNLLIIGIDADGIGLQIITD